MPLQDTKPQAGNKENKPVAKGMGVSALISKLPNLFIRTPLASLDKAPLCLEDATTSVANEPTSVAGQQEPEKPSTSRCEAKSFPSILVHALSTLAHSNCDVFRAVSALQKGRGRAQQRKTVKVPSSKSLVEEESAPKFLLVFQPSQLSEQANVLEQQIDRCKDDPCCRFVHKR